MARLFDYIRNIFSKKPKHEPAEVEALRIAFKDRYHNFKLLLNANNKSLEVMAGIEAALQGGRSFGMSFVRASYTAVSVNVFRMIKNLDGLSPGKYTELFNRFNEIKQNIDSFLTKKKEVKDERLLIPLDSIDKEMTDLVGNKMANLGEMKNRINLKVPGGFAITAFAYERFIKENDLQAEIDRRFQSADVEDMEELYTLSAEIQQLITRSVIPKDLTDAITEAYRQLEDEAEAETTVALRSSALGEDAAGSSFAGQYRSELNVSAENLFQAYKEVVASKYSLQAITYRINRGFRDEDISMCVGCMVMIDAAVGGVTYSRNPVDFRDDSIFINSVWGLPQSVVDGSVACDLFVVSREAPMAVISKDIKDKDRKFVCLPQEGICPIDLAGDTRTMPSINQNQAFALAELAVKLEKYYGSPQDIEWAITTDGSIYVLQCRPLQQMETEKSTYAKPGIKINEEDVIINGGITASPGSACGTVYLVDKGVDILKFPEGAILVTRQALPRWAPLLNRAAAVVTEQGGFAGHLANVAREFGVPALFGVNGAMDLLKNQDQVTVDAGNLTIFKGRIEALLKDLQPIKNPMEGSPVYETLKHISRSIVPLNLLDPDSHDFSPANCKTFHDITRFIHEKSVREMFNFGKEHDFSEKSSKQLYYNVPMQWWILNLDDGFNEDVDGKYVKLENIVSIPMLAFWEGFAAIPWDGPPAIDGKGLVSVIFQSTVNTALTPGVRSAYADRNYFMISKNYCSLSSRLGYHFSIMEALVSDRPIENYISFQFKGGATDYHRRLKRVHFIRDILEEHGFRVEIKEDVLIARLEAHEMDFMKKQIKILGYMSLHTRQLDMIMANSASVEYYRKKINKDIQTIVSTK